MDMFCMCRTCLNESNGNLISIHSDVAYDQNGLSTKSENRMQIANIIDEITGNKYNTMEFPYPDKICDNCLNDLKTAFQFKLRCEIAFERLIKSTEVNNKCVEQNNAIEQTENENIQIDNSDFENTDYEDAPDDGAYGEAKPIFVDSTKCNETDENDPIESHSSETLANVPIVNVQVEDIINMTPESCEKHTTKIVTKKRLRVEAAASRAKAFQCDNCNRYFTRKTHLRRHMTIHTDERAFACKSCDKKFRRADHLKIHENHHAKVKPHVCPYCQQSFSRAEHVRRHITCRHTQKIGTFACATCDHVATTAKELNRHEKTHVDTLFACKTCDEKFTTKTKLTDHTKKHISYNERPFLCSECGLRFVRQDYLLIHMRRHTGERPYRCKFCDRGFPRATDLTVHERYHTNEKKHICNVCGKGFQRAYNLTVHSRVHTGERPYQCLHCTKSFSQGNDLKAHVRRHTGERYQCEHCEASFIQIYLLKNHRKNAHGIDTQSNISRLTKFESSGQNEHMASQQGSDTNCTVQVHADDEY